MQVNNETGIRQPIDDIAKVLGDHDAYFHTDAAQGFGKDIEPLRNPRIDIISISGHKIYAPKGVGAPVMRRQGYDRPPLCPLVYGGGQERGLRPGTLPVALIAALGKASELALRNNMKRKQKCRVKKCLSGCVSLIHICNRTNCFRLLPRVRNGGSGLFHFSCSAGHFYRNAVSLVWKGRKLNFH